MTKLELLNVFLNDRLTAAAEEIFRAVKETVVEYQSEILRSKEENERLKRLLNVAVQRLLLQPGEDQQLVAVNITQPDPGLNMSALCCVFGANSLSYISCTFYIYVIKWKLTVQQEKKQHKSNSINSSNNNNTQRP